MKLIALLLVLASLAACASNPQNDTAATVAPSQPVVVAAVPTTAANPVPSPTVGNSASDGFGAGKPTGIRPASTGTEPMPAEPVSITMATPPTPPANSFSGLDDLSRIIAGWTTPAQRAMLISCPLNTPGKP